MCRELVLSLSVFLALTLLGDASATIVPPSSITAQAAGQFDPDTGPEKSIDGSGMLTGDYEGTHNQNKTDMWLSPEGGAGSASNHPFGFDCSTWIKCSFDEPYELGLMHVWNYNASRNAAAGLQDVYIHFSVTGGAEPTEWTPLPGSSLIHTFTQATGRYGERGKIEADFAGAQASYVVLTAAVDNGNFGHSQYGLAEVRFNIIPEPATILLLALGTLALRSKGKFQHAQQKLERDE